MSTKHLPSIAVPTSTVLAHQLGAPHMVYVIEHAAKHNGPPDAGGRAGRAAEQSHEQCAYDEWGQEREDRVQRWDS